MQMPPIILCSNQEISYTVFIDEDKANTQFAQTFEFRNMGSSTIEHHIEWANSSLNQEYFLWLMVNATYAQSVISSKHKFSKCYYYNYRHYYKFYNINAGTHNKIIACGARRNSVSNTLFTFLLFLTYIIFYTH